MKHPYLVCWLVLFCIVIISCKKKDDDNDTIEKPESAPVWTCNLTEVLDGWEITKHKLPEDPELFPLNFHFPTESFGVIVATDGNMIRTKDGGESWRRYSSGVALDIFSVFYLDDQIGFTGTGFTGSPGHLTGRGAYFSRIFTEFGAWEHFFFSEYTSFFDLLFFNKEEGMAVVLTSDSISKLQLIRTIDGGETWEPVDSLIQPSPQIVIKRIQDKVFVLGRPAGHIYTSSDKGLSWDTVKAPIRISDFETITDDIIYALSSEFLSSSILKTTDGGKSWDYPINNYYGNLRFHFNLNGEGFMFRQLLGSEGERAGSRIVTKGYSALETNDVGNTWQLPDSISTVCNNIVLGRYDFPNPDLGYVIADPRQGEPSKEIYRLKKK